MPDRVIVQALASFLAQAPDGTPVNVSAGDMFYDDDPIVKVRRALFAEPDVRSSADLMRRPRSETGPYATETAVAPPAGQVRGPVTKVGKVSASVGTARPAGEV